MSDQKPLVVLLDLDGTLAGRVTSVLCEYDVYKSMSLLGRPRGMPKHIRDSIVSRLRYGIIRPYVFDFCRGVADMGVGIELFVFTASENTWANFFVPCMESALGVRFNRPIFTRNHCVINQIPVPSGGGGGAPPEGRKHQKSVFMGGGVSVLKSISKLRPLIARALRGRYPGLRSPEDLVDRVILVDNTPHVMVDPRESKRLVVCPTYDYTYVYDVLAHLPVDVLHAHFAKLVPVLQRNGMFPLGLHGSGDSSGQGQRRIDTYSSFSAVYYRRLARLLDASAEINERNPNRDRFFLHLLHAMRMLVAQRSPENCFDDSGVAELSTAKSKKNVQNRYRI
jgi:hypothetical protein